MKKLVLILALAGAVFAQTVITDIGDALDSSGNGLSFSKGPTMVLVSCSDNEESVSTSIGLTVNQARSLQSIIAKGYNGRHIGKGKTASFGSVSSGNSDISLIVNNNQAVICLTEGRLNRYFFLDASSYNKVQNLLSKATGGARVQQASEPIQPKQPGLGGQSYPTHR